MTISHSKVTAFATGSDFVYSFPQVGASKNVYVGSFISTAPTQNPPVAWDLANLNDQSFSSGMQLSSVIGMAVRIRKSNNSCYCSKLFKFHVLTVVNPLNIAMELEHAHVFLASPWATQVFVILTVTT